MKYKILTALDHRALSKVVNQYLRDGWSPMGGVSPKGADYVMQAIIRTTEEKPDE
jgi:hypothetical protein